MYSGSILVRATKLLPENLGVINTTRFFIALAKSSKYLPIGMLILLEGTKKGNADFIKIAFYLQYNACLG